VKTGSTEYSKGNKTVPGKVATTHTKDGHKQITKFIVKESFTENANVCYDYFCLLIMMKRYCRQIFIDY